MVTLSRHMNSGSNMLRRCAKLNQLGEQRATLTCQHYSEYRVNDFMPRIVRPTVLIVGLSQKIPSHRDCRWQEVVSRGSLSYFR